MTQQATPMTQPTPAVRIRGLTKTFTTGPMWARHKTQALRDIDIDIAEGEIVALVGESGSGKSTLARCLARLERPDAGIMEVTGEDVLKTQPRKASADYRRRVQMIFQDPFASLNPAHRVEHVLMRSLTLHDRGEASSTRDTSGASPDRADRQQRLHELVRSVGLDVQVLSAFPHELSGGQRQRIAIGRALAVEPDVLLADEPTSMLDVSVRIGVLNLLARLREERGIAILYVTHDLASARYLSDRTMVMHEGQIVESGHTERLLANPSHPYTKLLVSAVPDPLREHAYDREGRAELRREIRRWSSADVQNRVSLTSDQDPDDHWILSPQETT